MPQRVFPTPGCKQAFDCGKEFVLSGAPMSLLGEALTFCDTPEEEAFFLFGCAEEARDLEMA